MAELKRFKSGRIARTFDDLEEFLSTYKDDDSELIEAVKNRIHLLEPDEMIEEMKRRFGEDYLSDINIDDIDREVENRGFGIGPFVEDDMKEVLEKLNTMNIIPHDTTLDFKEQHYFVVLGKTIGVAVNDSHYIGYSVTSISLDDTGYWRVGLSDMNGLADYTNVSKTLEEEIKKRGIMICCKKEK